MEQEVRINLLLNCLGALRLFSESQGVDDEVNKKVIILQKKVIDMLDKEFSL